jgi:hypothetical protein
MAARSRADGGRSDWKVERLLARCEAAGDQRSAAALRAWRALPQREQLALAAELAIARGVELKRAWPELLSVGCGTRTRTRGGKRVSMRGEVCVSFLVERKWPRGRPAARRERDRLPEFLFDFADDRAGRRTLVAVPTDVQCGSQYRLRPHLSRREIEGHDASGGEGGVLTGPFRIAGSTERFLGSAHHVLAPSSASSASIPGPAVVRLEGRDCAELAPWRGRLVPPALGPSLDFSLARVTELAVARAALGAAKSPVALCQRVLDLPQQAVLHGAARTLRLQFEQVWTDFDRIAYFATGPQPRHTLVVEWSVQATQRVAPGDSGAPVTSLAENRLLGLHLGGNAAGDRAIMLPIWIALDSAQLGTPSDPVALADLG